MLPLADRPIEANEIEADATGIKARFENPAFVEIFICHTDNTVRFTVGEDGFTIGVDERGRMKIV